MIMMMMKIKTEQKAKVTKKEERA
jgi:hypothetical protein